jgi:hypothetical protein
MFNVSEYISDSKRSYRTLVKTLNLTPFDQLQRLNLSERSIYSGSDSYRYHSTRPPRKLSRQSSRCRSEFIEQIREQNQNVRTVMALKQKSLEKEKE